jgi:hypothetical protein
MNGFHYTSWLAILSSKVSDKEGSKSKFETTANIGVLKSILLRLW